MLASSTEIEYFLEVYLNQHISKAAIRLGVTQPTLTLSLKKLEEKLGTQLFYRTKQGVVPTAQGMSFYRKALPLLEYWKDVQRGVDRANQEISGRFSVGCHPSVGAYALPKLLDRLREEAPAIKIELRHDVSRVVTEGIVSYKIDLGFVVNPARHPDLVLKKLGEDRVAFWKRRGTSRVPQIIFADQNLIQSQALLGKIHSKYFKGWELINTSSLELIRTLVLSGQGIGILPERVAKADEADLIPFESHLPTFEDKIFLAYRMDMLESRAGKKLVSLASIEL